MTKEEREAKIKEIKEKIFNIEVGSDFLSFEQSNRLRALYVMLRELEKKAEDECQGKAEGFCDVCMEKRCQGDEY